RDLRQALRVPAVEPEYHGYHPGRFGTLYERLQKCGLHIADRAGAGDETHPARCVAPAVLAPCEIGIDRFENVRGVGVPEAGLGRALDRGRADRSPPCFHVRTPVKKLRKFRTPPAA